MQIFGYFGYLCGLKWVKICWQIDTKENCLDGLFWVRVTHKMLNVNWEKIHSIILCHLWWLKKLFVTHTHPLEILHDPPNPTPIWHTPPHPYMTHPHPYPTWPTHPTPALHNTPHPNPPLYGPHPPHPTPTWPTPPHPCMTHPTPPPHDPPHPTLPYPTLPHPTYPTPPLEQFWEEMGWISWGPSLSPFW